MSDNNTIAFAMAKEVILNRRDSVSLKHRGKENDPSYWLEVYQECLEGLEKLKPSTTSNSSLYE